MSEIKNGRLGLYGTERLKYNRMVTLGFKGLTREGKPTVVVCGEFIAD